MRVTTQNSYIALNEVPDPPTKKKTYLGGEVLNLESFLQLVCRRYFFKVLNSGMLFSCGRQSQQ